MRWSTYSWTLVALLALAPATAFAAGGSEKGKSGGGSTGGSSGGGASGGSTGGSDTSDASRDRGVESADKQEKSWEVEADFEYHRLLIQNDLAGDGINKNFNYWLFGAAWDITKFDRVYARGGVYERFLADQGETGARLDDIIIGYTRTVPLPADIRLKATVRTVIPLSYESQLQGLITAPRVTLSLDRSFGPFDFQILGFLEGYIERYKEATGGNQNPTMRLGGLAELDFNFPFHKPLSIGADAYTASTWFYEPQGAPVSSSLAGLGSTTDPKNPNGQPLSQVYGGEVYVRYRLPELVGVRADIQLAYADGDPVLGYQNALHDGVFRFNGFYRHVSEVYLAVTAKY
jgi:hypothetical protein